MWQTAGDKN